MSPFVAGLWFEVLLATPSSSARRVVLVSALAIAALWIQAATGPGPMRTTAIAIHSGFVVALGGLAAVLARGWRNAQHAESEQSARLGHNLKNAVHSIRGFTQLIAPDADASQSEALAGLQGAVDRLHELAQTALPAPFAVSPSVASAAEIRTVLEDCVHDLSAIHPNVRCRLVLHPPARALPLSLHDLREVAWNLLLNAAQAMPEGGHVVVQARGDTRRWHVRVTDGGPGIAPDLRENLFRPGQHDEARGPRHRLVPVPPTRRVARRPPRGRVDRERSLLRDRPAARTRRARWPRF